MNNPAFPTPGAATLLYTLKSLLSCDWTRQLNECRNLQTLGPQSSNISCLDQGLLSSEKVPTYQHPQNILSCPKWNADQSIPIPEAWIGWCLCRIHQAESQIIWSFQSKAWYNKLIFLAEWWHDFSGAPTKTGEIPQTATKLSSALSFVAP